VDSKLTVLQMSPFATKFNDSIKIRLLSEMNSTNSRSYTWGWDTV